MHAGHQQNYSRYPAEASLHEKSTFADRNESRGPDIGSGDRVYNANNRTNLGIHDLQRQGLIRSDERAAESQRDPLNTAMYTNQRMIHKTSKEVDQTSEADKHLTQTFLKASWNNKCN